MYNIFTDSDSFADKAGGVAGWTTTSVTSHLGCLPWCKRAVKVQEGGEVESNEVGRICNTCKAGAFGSQGYSSNGGVLLVGGTCQAWCSPPGFIDSFGQFVNDGVRRCGTGSAHKTSGSTDCRSDGVTDGDTSPAAAIAAVVIVVVLLVIAV